MQRLNPFAIVPDAYKAVSGVESYIRNCGLEKSLIHLVKMRASQINGCAYCLDMHSKEARKDGETDQRLHLLGAWDEVTQRAYFSAYRMVLVIPSEKVLGILARPLNPSG